MITQILENALVNFAYVSFAYKAANIPCLMDWNCVQFWVHRGVSSRKKFLSSLFHPLEQNISMYNPWETRVIWAKGLDNNGRLL